MSNSPFNLIERDVCCDSPLSLKAKALCRTDNLLCERSPIQPRHAVREQRRRSLSYELSHEGGLAREWRASNQDTSRTRS
jgi:hypothetical protein